MNTLNATFMGKRKKKTHRKQYLIPHIISEPANTQQQENKIPTLFTLILPNSNWKTFGLVA